MIKNIAVISLGCDKNRVDTETMLYNLASAGKDYVIVNDYSLADAIIVNTCAFIESARVEAIETILEMAEYKKDRCKKLIVTGCLPQKYLSELTSDLPEVDAFLGIDEYEKIASLLDSESGVANQNDSNPCKRVLTTPAHYAFLKIADGCNNHCTFCTIPSIRGAYRSRPIEELVKEAQALASKGVSELILVAQDVTSYGKDLFNEPSLIRLLAELEKTDITYIRLMYCYPELVTDDLIKFVANSKKVLHYMDIPLQHVSDPVLKRMGRRSSKTAICEMFTKLRNSIPDIAIRTTMMVGFPGETDDQFDELYDFVKEYKPDNMGIFAYSKEEGTPSAKLKGHLTKAVKVKRLNKLGKLNAENCLNRNKNFIGKIVDVIYEDIDYDKGLFVGRTLLDAPEIDGNVYFSGEFADVGTVYKVKITDCDEYDLFGELV